MNEVKGETLFERALLEISQMGSTEEKIRKALAFMKSALQDEGRARFSDFWRMKKECLDHFKKELSHPVRTLFWNEYIALITEAHAIQKIVEENSRFEIEQVTLAIDHLEETINLFSLDGEKTFDELKKENATLGVCKERVLALRQEVIALGMRVSQKSKLLDRLTKIGNIVFPRKKMVQRKLSELLESEVKAFCLTNFDLDLKELKGTAAPFKVRSGIKSFQATLRDAEVSNDIYQKTRALLSLSWDILESKEEKKKEIQEDSSEEKFSVLINELQFLLKEGKKKEVRALEKRYLEVSQLAKDFKVNKQSSLIFQNLCLSLQDLILKQKVNSLTSITEDEVVKQLTILRSETKRLTEIYRKELASCGLDIELALTLKGMITENKHRLERIEADLQVYQV